MSKKGHGVSGEDMKKYGRNLARAYNQGGKIMSGGGPTSSDRKEHGWAMSRAINQAKANSHAGRKSGGRGR